jgi:hypothetical protein
LLVVVALINLMAVSADEKIQTFSPQVDCVDSSSITAEEALKDYNSTGQKQGLMTCYCQYQSTQNLSVD